MAGFSLKYSLLAWLSIIVLIANIGHSMSLSEGATDALQDDILVEESHLTVDKTAYIEKIEQFSLQEFDKERLSSWIKAKIYYSFSHQSALLVEPELVLYDVQGSPEYTINATYAHYLSKNTIRFSGDVYLLSKIEPVHQLSTQELLVDISTNHLSSSKKTTYLADQIQVIANQGMQMWTKSNQAKVIGKTVINQKSGQKILTKNLNIDQSEGQNRYYSKHNTIYLSKKNTIYANAGVNFNAENEVIKLLGEVKIIDDFDSQINTRNLVVEQSSDGEIYKTTEAVHYQSKDLNVYANGMLYDSTQQKITLNTNVRGRYE